MSDQRPPSGDRSGRGGSGSGGRPSGGRGGSSGSSSSRGGSSGGSRGGSSGGSRGGSSGGSGKRSGGGRSGPSNGGRSGNSSGAGRPTGSGGQDRPDNKFQRAGQSDRAPGLERPRVQAPPLPEGITGAGLDEDVQAELRSLTKETADDVGAHLAATAMLLDEDPEAAYLHAVYVKARASRVGSAREAVGLAAYMTGRYAEALSELRAVKRIHGTDVHLPVMADCQRGLGRPERALEMAGSPEAAALDAAGQVEMRIVASGARQDLGQNDAAVLTLQCAQLRDAKAEWAPRLRYAYAEALITAGRVDEGREWMAKAVDADKDASTDAAERLAELEGVTFYESVVDDEDDADEAPVREATNPPASSGAPAAAPAAPAAQPPVVEPPVVEPEVVEAPIAEPRTNDDMPLAPTFSEPPPPAPVSKPDEGPAQLSFLD